VFLDMGNTRHLRCVRGPHDQRTHRHSRRRNHAISIGQQSPGSVPRMIPHRRQRLEHDLVDGVSRFSLRLAAAVPCPVTKCPANSAARFTCPASTIGATMVRFRHYDGPGYDGIAMGGTLAEAVSGRSLTRPPVSAASFAQASPPRALTSEEMVAPSDSLAAERRVERHFTSPWCTALVEHEDGRHLEISNAGAVQVRSSGRNCEDDTIAPRRLPSRILFPDVRMSNSRFRHRAGGLESVSISDCDSPLPQIPMRRECSSSRESPYP